MQACNQRGAIRQLTPRNFHKRMYLLGAATSYIILLPPEYISWLQPCLHVIATKYLHKNKCYCCWTVSMAWLRNKKYFENELLLSQGLSFNAHKLYITAIFTHLVVKLYKNKTLRCSTTADAAHKSTMYSTVACQFYQRGISAMFLKWSGIQQAGEPETAAKGVNPCFTFGYWLQARIYKSVFHHHQLPHGA